MMGIEALEVTGSEVMVTYDLLQATAFQIEAELAQAGRTWGMAGAKDYDVDSFITPKSAKSTTSRLALPEGVTDISFDHGQIPGGYWLVFPLWQESSTVVLSRVRSHCGH